MNPVIGKLTTNFTEQRPLSKPLDERDHVHGAIDLAAPRGTPIYMPENGFTFAWAAYRPKAGMYWPEMPEIEDFGLMPWCNYFYDTFGGVIIARSADEYRTHVICHSYSNQLFNKNIFDKILSIEETEDRRFPIHAYYTPRKLFVEGDIIGYVGNAGYSTGAHAHWEIHTSNRWQRWENRINPEGWEV